MLPVTPLVLAALLVAPSFARADVALPARFEFANTAHSPGEDWTPVAPAAAYDASTGFGYEGPHEPGKPFRFSVKLPEGNYRVTVQLGDAKADSVTTVKAEQRRLMLENVAVPAGQLVTRSFVVNVRAARISDAAKVRLNDREVGTPNWDDKLNLEILGEHPAVANVEVDRVDDVPTIFVAGDSTVTDQFAEPWAGWGQVLPRFVRPDVAVANYAESGRTLTSFAGDRRLEKILSVAKPGDFLFIQFGHNDMKDKGPDAGAYGNYTANLKKFVAAARDKRMTPVILTPMHRRQFDENGKVKNSFGDYPDAARKVAADEKVDFIDLNEMSAAFYEAMGPDESTKAFVHYPAGTYPGQNAALKDNTHHNTYGAYELARCVVEGMRNDPALAPLVVDDTKPFDPAKPDDVRAFKVPASLWTTSTTKPAGN